MKKLPLSANLLAALQVGAVAPDAVAAPENNDTTAQAAAAGADTAAPQKPETPAAAPAAAATEAPAGDAPAAAPETAAAPAAPAAPATSAAQDSALVGYLRDEVKELKAQLAAANESVSTLKAENTSLKASSSPRLLGIVRTSAQRLAIALGTTPVGIERLEGEALADQFEALDAKVRERFKVGAVSNATEDAAPASTSAGGVVPLRTRSSATKL